ncbi:MAG: AIR synthase-related protein, partial [Elusimicrobiota bacterium]
THNHPSAIEPYGGAGTGIGGVIRDILGVGLGAKPVMNTDVFCFGPLDYPSTKLPENVLHPKRIFKGVVSGVKDYGNRMGIPTGNGAVVFDEGFVYNPLVYCGTVGIIPKDKCFKAVHPGEVVVAVGGRTGRDGIHGATFSSLSLDKDTPLSPVQIGNAIVEKKVLDTLMQARDLNLYTAITDCGAGGFSSAVGELGEECGVKVYLDRAPLKYEGLLPWEIWLSEAQERMVLSVPKKCLKQILQLFKNEDVEATVLGEFTDTKKLEMYYNDKKIGELEMLFLHHGYPRFHKQAKWVNVVNKEPNASVLAKKAGVPGAVAGILKKVLGDHDVCSKEWIIRQYDHEVQGQTVVKPLLGKHGGPGDACVSWPVSCSGQFNTPAEKYKGFAVSCGINPQYGKIDPYWMTASAIDEALRNIVAVGGDLRHAALLDNFCWGSPNKPQQMAGVVRAALACYDYAKLYGTPFISGKDSLNNEYVDIKGVSRSIPGTMLISAISIVPDVRKTVMSGWRKRGSLIYLLGTTYDEYGGSVYYRINGCIGNSVPKVNGDRAREDMYALGRVIAKEIVLSCHDCSDGGLGSTLAEMAFTNGIGAEIELKKVPFEFRYSNKRKLMDTDILFSESNSRFVVEVERSHAAMFERMMKGTKIGCIGFTISDPVLRLRSVLDNEIVMEESLTELMTVWKHGLGI